MRLFWGIVLGVAMLAVGMPSDAQALTLYTDRAAWEAAVGNHADVDLAGQYDQEWNEMQYAQLPSGDYIGFDESMEGVQVPTEPVTGWSGGHQPFVLLTGGYNWGWFEKEYQYEEGWSYWDYSSKSAFGLEIQPFISQDSIDYYNWNYTDDDGASLPDSLFDAFDVDLVLYDDVYYGVGEEGLEGGDFWPEPTVLRQRVGVNDGAAFFGWAGGNVWDFEIYFNGNPVFSADEYPEYYDGNQYFGDEIYGDGFAIGRMVEGIPTTTTPEPASMLLMGLGAAGTFLRRRKR